jgi:hypothetical protein
MTKKDLSITLTILVLVAGFIVYLYIVNEIDITNAISLFVTLILVAVTAVNVQLTTNAVISAKHQANASIKMAEEMKNQRYDSVRPVLDIEVISSGIELSTLAYTKDKSKIILQHITCKLHNVGVGPAIDVFSHRVSDGKCVDYPWGIISVGVDMCADSFALDNEADGYYVISKYKDIYNRDFLSRRKVITSSSEFVTGSLEINLIGVIR